jgi:hypothetical protein
LDYLTNFLYKCHKKDVLIFVDQYDAPIINEKQNFDSSDNWREATQLVRTFVTALEWAGHVRLLLIFGTHRFHVASHRFYVFGTDMDIQKPQTGLIRFFGFSYDEFEELLENYKVENKSEAKLYYNGKLFIFSMIIFK